MFPENGLFDLLRSESVALIFLFLVHFRTWQIHSISHVEVWKTFGHCLSLLLQFFFTPFGLQYWCLGRPELCPYSSTSHFVVISLFLQRSKTTKNRYFSYLFFGSKYSTVCVNDLTHKLWSDTCKSLHIFLFTCILICTVNSYLSPGSFNFFIYLCTSIHRPNTYKDTKPKCRLFWCLIEFIDWRCSQSCWYFRTLL